MTYLELRGRAAIATAVRYHIRSHFINWSFKPYASVPLDLPIESEQHFFDAGYLK